LPSCGAYLSLVHNELKWTDVGSRIASNSIHDGAHLWTAGVGGECTNITEKIQGMAGSSLTRALVTIIPATTQWMWRANIQKAPMNCSRGEPCMNTCTKNFTAGSEIVVGMLETFGYVEEIEEWKTNPRNVDIFQILYCETKTILGDGIDAGGANDPTFWTIHPSLDRLYQYKNLVNPMKDMYWPNGGAPAWSKSSIDNTACSTFPYPSKCASHHASEKIAFKIDTLKEDGGYSESFPSNIELLQMMSPAGDYRLSYIYENFRYAHCKSEGYHFPEVPMF